MNCVPVRPMVRGTTMCFMSYWLGCLWSRKRSCTCKRQSLTFTWIRWVRWGCFAAADRVKWPSHHFCLASEAPDNFASFLMCPSQDCAKVCSAPSHTWPKKDYLCLLCDLFLIFQAPCAPKESLLKKEPSCRPMAPPHGEKILFSLPFLAFAIYCGTEKSGEYFFLPSAKHFIDWVNGWKF